MFSPSTILTVYFAPKDAYGYSVFREWHERTKRRWREADVLGADEVKVMENNRRHVTKYMRKLKIFGWLPDTKTYADGSTYEKTESAYSDVVGDPYFNYFSKFTSHILDWWGVGGKYTKKSKAARNKTSIPNTPMLDVSMSLDANSLMEKMYLKGMSYDEATMTTFKGRHHTAELIQELTTFNKGDGMEEKEAYAEALRLVEIVQRNLVLNNNSPTTNEYNFMVNYYNRFIDKKRREMMKVDINIWFLKEFMSYHPNVSLYVAGPYNLLYRIHGIVSKRDQNVILQMEAITNTKKYVNEYTYSVARDTLVNEADAGYIPAKKLSMSKSKILNVMYGRKKLSVDHRYRTETFYDLILDGQSTNGRFPWFDAHHNCWASPDYSVAKNLQGLDIVC